ncbi:uncharacterized protein [Rutidosis leptorrhynchoides]|uniref:uncharacterized protein n=1 Tax=Rutidosis leptorrhynchoides TaxID=125765 RepID=UPI003A9A41F6
MAIDLFSTDINSGNSSSPRISFSYDLSQSDTVPVEQFLRSFSSSSSSNVDFNFCVHETHHAMADELFMDGKIVPSQMIKSKSNSCKRTQSSPKPCREDEKLHPQEEELKQQNSKSFWGGFKRSSSCGNGYARSLCPITLLSRSHSTGSSSTSSKRSSSSKETINNQKHRSSQKPPLRKNGYGYGNNTCSNNNNGVRVNPVLNLGFGSLFASSNKNKNKK